MNKYDEDDEATYEPEWCEDCVEEADAAGFEYEPNFTWESDTWVCDSCGRPV